jgi:membrane-bound serine protease (ClpP class)
LLHMRGAEGEVIDWAGAEGHVWLAGERWQAKASESLKQGDRVRVEKVDGLTLYVKRSN